MRPPGGFRPHLPHRHRAIRIPSSTEKVVCSRVILGVDRLDCIKGISQKLHAFDELLELYPQLIGHVVLLQVAIPSRDDLKAHQDLKEEIQQLVGRINDIYGMSFHPGVTSLSLEMIRDGTILTTAQSRSTMCLSSTAILPLSRMNSQPCTPPPKSVSFRVPAMV
jgi:trehalose 6-phosphate synthase